jgi:hypothetical protein
MSPTRNSEEPEIAASEEAELQKLLSAMLALQGVQPLVQHGLANGLFVGLAENPLAGNPPQMAGSLLMAFHGSG